MAREATETLGQGRCPRRRMVVVGSPLGPSPVWAAAVAGASLPFLPEVRAVPEKCMDLPTKTFPHLPVRLRCLKQAWIFLFTQHHLPKSNCVSFVFLSLYVSEVKQRDVANGIILTHLCHCY